MMNKIFYSLLLFNGLHFATAQDLNKNKIASTSFKTVEIDTLFQEKISIRAIVFDNDKIWYAGNKNRFGFYDLKTNTKFENKIVEDTLNIEFRSIAKTDSYLYVLSVANPALLYQISKDGKQSKLVYKESNKKVFYEQCQHTAE